MKKVNPAFLVMCLVFGLFVGVSGYTFFYADGASYLSEDPEACVNCHIMQDQYDGWRKSSHRQVASCVQCHLPHQPLSKYLSKLENGYHHSAKFTLQNFEEPIKIKKKNLDILNRNCIECHQTLVSDVSFHPNILMEPMNCVKCHSDVGHGTQH